MMQYDPDWENRTFEKTKIASKEEYSVVPNKSVSTYGSFQTAGSKRSTEEEELRSLSTTPRYSHEDLGDYIFRLKLVILANFWTCTPHVYEPEANNQIDFRQFLLKLLFLHLQNSFTIFIYVLSTIH